MLSYAEAETKITFSKTRAVVDKYIFFNTVIYIVSFDSNNFNFVFHEAWNIYHFHISYA